MKSYLPSLMLLCISGILCAQTGFTCGDKINPEDAEQVQQVVIYQAR